MVGGQLLQQRVRAGPFWVSTGSNDIIGEVLAQADEEIYNRLTAGVLDGHLADIEEQAQELFLRLVEQYADTEGVTERLKASEPQSWVRKMNGIRN